MRLTVDQKKAIRRRVLDRCVPAAKSILEDGDLIPDGMSDEDAFREVRAVLAELSAEIRRAVPE